MKGNKYRALFGKRQRMKVIKKTLISENENFCTPLPPQHNVYVDLSNLGSTVQHCFVRMRQEGRKIEQRLHSSKEFVTSSAPTTLGTVKNSLYSNLIK